MTNQEYKDLKEDWQHDCKKDRALEDKAAWTHYMKRTLRLALAGNRRFQLSSLAMMYKQKALDARYLRQSERLWALSDGAKALAAEFR